MSIHLVTETSATPLPASHKLVLLCLAESARNDYKRLAWPGMPALRMWSGLSESRVLAVLGELEKRGLIARVGRGQKYRRAEFVVFPKGCCRRHGAVSASYLQGAEKAPQPTADKRLKDSQGLISENRPTLSGSYLQDPFPSVLTSECDQEVGSKRNQLRVVRDSA